MRDTLQKYKGKIIITNHTTGVVKKFDNLVMDKFYELVSDFMAGTSPNKLSHIALGTDDTLPTVSDTSLGSESFRKGITTTSTPGSQIHLQTEVTGGEAIFTWKEIGVFNNNSGGDMTNRAVIDFTHNSGDAVTIDYFIDKQT